ncbi:MAG TPA: DUF2314 domain-containing protein, partial [Pirellulaceae bacterium]|nr:DUF2314 domain-containing protein [Pirellulaceae bacterium]
EFAEAFAKRKANEDFLVKMQFTDETQSEFMWITVEQIENEVIKGKLENQPMFIDNLKVGDTVQVPLRDLNDWVMVRNGEMVGGFTIKVLEKKASGKRAP